MIQSPRRALRCSIAPIRRFKLSKATSLAKPVPTGLPFGDSRFAVTSGGFVRRQLTLTFHNGKEVRAEVHLWLPFIGTVVDVKPKPPRKLHGWLQY